MLVRIIAGELEGEMSRKFTAARRNAFLRALAESGNQTLAAERAKVSRSWVRLHRSTDPGFDASCREAIALAKMMLSDDDSPKPQDPRWRYADGHELVVSGSNGRRTQIRRSRLRQWTPRVEDRFIAVLASTCNVKLACREVGLAFSSAYNHRKRWPAFARRWDQAVDMGYCELEAALIQNACHYLNPADAPVPDQLLEGMSVAHAIDVARMNWGKVRALRRRGEDG